MNKIKLLQSGYGDCILVSIQSKSDGLIHFLIDCGFKYSENLKPELEKIDRISRLIVTHFDRDHIEGISKFIKENGNTNEPKIVKVDQVWLNTFNHIRKEEKSTVPISQKEKIKVEAFNSGNSERIRSCESEEDISAEHAVNLSRLLKEGNYLLNTDFNNYAISTDSRKEVKINDDISIHLLSPNNLKLKVIEDEFRTAIYNLTKRKEIPEDEIFDVAFELFTQVSIEENIEENISLTLDTLTIERIEELSDSSNYLADNSVANGSSIAFILKVNKKSILFLADAHSEVIEEGLEPFYERNNKEPLFFDAIKVSHHGSNGNTSPKLLQMIDSPKYLFSTNSKGYGHPDLETIARVINREIHNSFDFNKRELIFNYELDHIKGLDDENLKRHYNYFTSIKQEIEF